MSEKGLLTSRELHQALHGREGSGMNGHPLGPIASHRLETQRVPIARRSKMLEALLLEALAVIAKQKHKLDLAWNPGALAAHAT